MTEILRRLALHGLVHCDFNEFNLMVDQEGQVTLIDFPQVRIGQEGRVGRGSVDRTLYMTL